MGNSKKYEERKYSLVDAVFSVETATFPSVVFQSTPTLDTWNPPNGLPKQEFLYLVLKVGYLSKKTKDFNQFSLTFLYLLFFYFLAYLKKN